MADKPYEGSIKPSTSDFIPDIPQTAPDDSDEKRRKSISRTKRWKEFMAFADGRIDSYKQYLPGGNPAVKKSDDNWVVAECVINELQIWKNFIETGDL